MAIHSGPRKHKLGVLVLALFVAPVLGAISFAAVRFLGEEKSPRPASSLGPRAELGGGASPKRHPLTRGEYLELFAAALAGQLARGCAGEECSRRALTYAQDAARALEASPDWPGRATMVLP